MILINEKIDLCKNSIIRAYNESNKISNFVSKSLQPKTDGAYTQIGLKQIINPVWFTDESYVPLFGDLGLAVSEGELRYMIECISKQENKIQSNKINAINPSKMVEVIDNIAKSKLFDENKTVILVPLYIKWENFLEDKMHFGYDNKINKFVVDTGTYKIPLYEVRDDIIGNKIIILNRDFGLWKYIQFKNFDSGRLNDIQVEIKFDERLRLYILVRTLVKLEILKIDNC